MALQHGGFDCFGDVGRRLMLPEPQDRPSSCEKSFVVLTVALAVTRELRRPVAFVRDHRSATMLRTSVPEAAIDEHRHSLPSEGYIGPDRASVAHAQRKIHPVAKARGMETPPHRELRVRVTAAVGSLIGRSRRRPRRRRHPDAHALKIGRSQFGEATTFRLLPRQISFRRRD